MTVNERLKVFAQEKGITQYRLAKEVGVTPQAISRIFSNRVSSINSDTLALFVERFPELNIRWLLIGDGEMTVSKSAFGGGENGEGLSTQTELSTVAVDKMEVAENQKDKKVNLELVYYANIKQLVDNQMPIFIISATRLPLLQEQFS